MSTVGSKRSGARSPFSRYAWATSPLTSPSPGETPRPGVGHTGFVSVPDPHASLEQATARRDLTINALMYAPVPQSGIDCWDGLGDLRAKALRHTTERFAEDPLRVMRAVGFVARFGFTLHPSTVALSRSSVRSSDELVMKRMWQEWHEIAAKGTYLAEALETLHATGWDAHFPHLAALHAVEQDAHWHPEGNVFIHSGLAASKAAALADEAGLEGDDRVVVVLAALVHDFGKVTHTQVETDADGRRRVRSKGHAQAGVEPAMGFLTQIGAPRSIRERVAPLVREHMASTGTTARASAVRRLARRLAPATMAEWALVVEADKGGRGAGSISGDTAQWLAVAAALGAERAPRPSILRGRHLIDAGMTPGPDFKDILERALAAQDEGAFGDEAGALAWLRAQSVLPA